MDAPPTTTDEDDHVAIDEGNLLVACSTTTAAATGNNNSHLATAEVAPGVCGTSNNNDNQDDANENRPWGIYSFLAICLLDWATSLLLLSPLLPWVQRHAGESHHFTFYGSLQDLLILAVVRLALIGIALLLAFCSETVPPEYPFDLYHPNGDKKSSEELEHEALEESFVPWLKRFTGRPAFAGETVAMLTQACCIAKCLCRMNMEIGTLEDRVPVHPLFWFAVLFTTVFSVLEAQFLDCVCNAVGLKGKEKLGRNPRAFLRTVSSSLSLPLLADRENSDVDTAGGRAGATDPEQPQDPNEVRGESDISGDAKYKAGWTDLLSSVYPDMHLIECAFVFLLGAAVAQVYIPHFLGNILDALAAAFSDGQPHHDESMWDIPGFMENVRLLVTASVLAGIFSGVRSSLFTLVGGRVNVRLRIQLFDSLLSQDIGFFDVTKTGDILSRLSSDATKVGDQIAVNVNVFLRSLVQACGVLLFMFVISWQLTLLAFISVPVITVISKWYGNYLRSLTKLMQKKLAEGNSICEAALSSMSTVRAFDASDKELSGFEEFMSNYLALNTKCAVGFCAYVALTVALPQLVFALVIFYGGLLVRNGDMTSGSLVSFLLYLQSLSDAFASIGYIFSSLTQSVGAADKVFELMHRKPRMKTPPTTDVPDAAVSDAAVSAGLVGISAKRSRLQRMLGRHPSDVRGEIVLDNVEMYYPARPQRRILHELTLKVESGSIVALVGQSGGGKSSVMSLIQHLYEPSSGKVLLDGIEVHELSPAWLSRAISIVSQEPTLFARSIRKNIMYGLEGTDEEPTQDEIEEAAKFANAHDFIMSMPQKYDTEVGERGVQLSGGQKQRIAIARALVRRPRVLLLDEATSALDAESEHLVQQAIDDMLARDRDKSNGSGRAMTVIIVAHRLSTVRKADRICVIKDGRVVEEGSHDELVQDPDGAYSSLIRRQMEAQQKLEGDGGTGGAEPLADDGSSAHKTS